MNKPRKDPPRRRKHAKAPSERAMLFSVERLMNPDTGEVIGCLVPASPLDRSMLRQRNLCIGTLCTVDVFAERHGKFWRLWHKLGQFLADNVDDMNGLNAHDALKRVQLDAKVHCELADFHLEDGTRLRHFVAKSLNFQDTDESAAQEVWSQLCDYVARTYFSGWDEEQVAEAAAHWTREA